MKPQITRSQESVLKLLETLDRPLSAQALYTQTRQQNQRIGLATVYRSLEALKLQGLVQSRSAANGESLYSLVKQDQHYLTCLHCGESFPLESCPVHDLEMQLRSSASFKVFYHTLEFFGLCSPCQSEH